MLVKFEQLGDKKTYVVYSEFKEDNIGILVEDCAGYYGFAPVDGVVLIVKELLKIAGKISELNVERDG